MTLLEDRPQAEATPVERVATRRRYLMCEPRHFAVEYVINPWMDPTVPVDRRGGVKSEHVGDFLLNHRREHIGAMRGR